MTKKAKQEIRGLTNQLTKHQINKNLSWDRKEQNQDLGASQICLLLMLTKLYSKPKEIQPLPLLQNIQKRI